MITLQNSKVRQETKYAETFNIDKFEIFFGHLIEEVGEARKCIPRKEWKDPDLDFSSSKEDFEEYVFELVDIHLFIENSILFIDPNLDFDFESFYKTEYEEKEIDFYDIIVSMNDLIISLSFMKNQFQIDLADSFLEDIAYNFLSILEFSQVEPETFLSYYNKKLAFNQVREDHKK